MWSQDYDVNKVNTYSTIIAIVLIYSILIFYVTYTYREDFLEAFCPKKKKVHDSTKVE